MATITKATSRHSNFAVLLFIIFAFAIIMMALTACGTKEAVAADPNASAAAVEEEQTPPPVNDFLKQFGDVVTYDDGISVSVQLVGPFTPSNLEYMPLAEGETAMVFKVVLTNNSEDVLEPGAVAQANSGGKPATYIANAGNPEYGDLGLFPTTSVLPGQTLEWYTAFGVADPADITLEISPSSFEYDNAIFTNAAF